MSGGKRQRAGRKAIKIDLEQVEKLCNLQCTDSELASFFGVSVRTIERRKSQPAFAECMSRGLLTLRRNLWSLAGKGNPAANIFLAKNLLGYRDYVSNELSGPDGGPIAIAPAPELGALSDDEIKQLALLVGKAERPRNG
jgi:hypothetical protein